MPALETMEVPRPKPVESSTAAVSKRPPKVSLSLNCPRNIKINENVEIKELRNEKGTKRFFRITIPRELVKDAVGDAPKKIVKSMKRLADSSSSNDNDSEEHRVADNQSISHNGLTSHEESSEKPSK